MDITKGQILKAEQILRDNGIADDEVQTVLQAIGYALCNTELYPEEPSERVVEDCFEENLAFCNGSFPMAAYRWLLTELCEHLHCSIYDEQGVEKGMEFETWTNGGVDMFTFIDFRDDLDSLCNPYTFVKKFREWVDNFDVDEEIRIHMEGSDYRRNFSYAEAVEDFNAYVDEMKGYADKLEEMLSLVMEGLYGLTPEMCEGVFFSLKTLVEGLGEEVQV